MLVHHFPTALFWKGWKSRFWHMWHQNSQPTYSLSSPNIVLILMVSIEKQNKKNNNKQKTLHVLFFFISLWHNNVIPLYAYAILKWVEYCSWVGQQICIRADQALNTDMSWTNKSDKFWIVVKCWSFLYH